MEEQPIIIKRVKKVVGGHHGGAWKVAFADFATAMMAFFLVLWLTTNASPEQKRAIEGYFKDPVGYMEAASRNPIDLGGSAALVEASSEDVEGSERSVAEQKQVDEQQIEVIGDSREKREMQELFENLKTQIENSKTLQKFKDQLMIDITDEGLRIQIVDRSKRPMFDSGSATLKYYSQDILFELAKPLGKVDKKLSITGHTDATSFSGRPGYTNWELSADRANTARRALVAGGVGAQQVARVVGLSDSVLFNRNDPNAPVNRRIAIIVLNKRAEDAIQSRASGQSEPLIDLTRPSEEDVRKAQADLESGDLFETPVEPDPEEVNW
jgi:chemotaxis protein MotB